MAGAAAVERSADPPSHRPLLTSPAGSTRPAYGGAASQELPARGCHGMVVPLNASLMFSSRSRKPGLNLKGAQEHQVPVLLTYNFPGRENDLLLSGSGNL